MNAMSSERIWPAHVDVTWKGQGEPSCYAVLDVVNDYLARCVLRRLANDYRMVGAVGQADELDRFLDVTLEAHGEAATRRAKRLIW